MGVRPARDLYVVWTREADHDVTALPPVPAHVIRVPAARRLQLASAQGAKAMT